MLTEVKIKKLKEGAKLPERQTSNSAGADLYACLDFPVEILPHQTVQIGLGFASEFNPGYAAYIFPRSGLSIKQGLAPANKVEVIDADYRGEWIVGLHNHSGTTKIVENGDRIAQVIFMEVETPAFEETDELSDTKRGAGGIGSTGR